MDVCLHLHCVFFLALNHWANKVVDCFFGDMQICQIDSSVCDKKPTKTQNAIWSVSRDFWKIMNYSQVLLSPHKVPGCHNYSYFRRRGWVHGWKFENIYWLPTCSKTHIQGWSENWQINLSIKKDVSHFVDLVLQIIWRTLLMMLQITKFHIYK